jgi:hypothetical protein
MGDGMDGVGTSLPVQHLTERIGNDRGSIEAAAKRLAAAAFEAAIQRERKEYFQRASEGGGRKRRPERCQMKADRAKQLAGRYAVCQRVGNRRLLPVAGTHERLEDANAEWRERQNRSLLVACCNRLDRCWELPRFNPLYAEFDPWQEERPALAAAEPPEAEPQQARAASGSQAALSVIGFVGTNPGQESSGGDKQADEQVDDDWQYLPGPDNLNGPHEDGDEDSDEEQQP